MPKIQEYRLRTTPQGLLQVGNIQASPDGQGLSQLGSSLGQFAQTVSHYLEQKQVYDAQKVVAESHGEWRETLDKMKREAPEGAPGFVEQVKDRYESWKATKLESVGGLRGRKTLAVGLETLRDSVLNSAIHIQADLAGKKERTDFQRIHQNNLNAVRANPQLRDEVAQNEKELIAANPYFNQTEKGKLSFQAHTEVWDTSLDAFVTQYEVNDLVTPYEIKNALSKLRDEKQGWISNVSHPLYQQALHRLERRLHQLSLKQDKEDYLDFKDRMKQIEETGQDHGLYTKEQIQSQVKDPMTRAKMIKRQSEARAAGRVVAAIKDKPFREAAKIVQAIDEYLPQSPVPGETFDQKKFGTAIYNDRVKRFKEDPVKFVLEESEGTKKILKQFTDERTPENAAQYAETVMIEQERLSPGVVPHILTQDQIGMIKNQLAEVPNTEEGKTRAVNLLQGEMMVWGKYWPRVVSDLKAKEALNDAQYVAAGLFDKPQVRYLAEDLIRASLVSDEELKKLLPQTGLSDRTQNEAIKALGNFRRSLDASANGFQIYQSYENALTRLLRFKGALQGENLSIQAQDYANKMVLDYYTFTPEGYRVPIEENAELIRKGALSIKPLLNEFPIVQPKGQEKNREEYISKLKNNGRLVNTGDSGLKLIDQVGHDVYVREGNDIVPLRWSWDDLKSQKPGIQLYNIRLNREVEEASK